ncbi:MAG: SdrD B-like domain-containing protein [Planctomycetota bacterium]
MTLRRLLFAAAVPCLVAPALPAGTIGGVLFADRNRNGRYDPGEMPLAQVEVQLYGQDGAVRAATRSNDQGQYRFTDLEDGSYVVSARPGPGWRASLQDRTADLPPVPDLPFGRPRFASMPGLVDALVARSGVSRDYRHVALGDSIGFGFNFCGSFYGRFGYIEPATERLRRATAGRVITDKQAILGHTTAQLLDPGLGPNSSTLENDVFYAIRQAAPLVSISIGGNDFLDAEGGGDSALAAAIVRARQNLQEILSALVTGLPDGEAEINTVYDDLEGGDAAHNVWVPIWDQMLREQAWGQVRRVLLAEIYPEYAHEDNGQIRGQTGLICHLLGLDGIHPSNFGYRLHEEKLWQAFGGVTIHDQDRLDLDLGYLEMAGGRLPTRTVDVGGNTTNDRLALMPDGVGALVSASDAEFRVTQFTAPPRATRGPADVESSAIAQAVLKVRYRTLGAPVDDHYAIEASIDGTFQTPGKTPSTWNTILPVVGSSGEDGAEWLVFPYQPTFRTVAAPLYLGAPRDARASLNWDDLKTLSVRVVTHAVNTPDAYAIELDAAWIEIATMPAGTPYARQEPRWRAGLPRLLATDPAEAARRLRSAIDRGEVDAELVAQLGELARPDDVAALRALSTHGDPMVRASALRALSSATDAAVDLAAATQDPAAPVRLAAAAELARRTAANRTDLLATLARDPSPRVRRTAATATDVPAALLRDLLGDADEGVRVVAAAGLLERGDASGWSLLASAMARSSGPLASRMRSPWHRCGSSRWCAPRTATARRRSRACA